MRSTLGVAAGWPVEKRAVAHWYQLGDTAATGFQPFAALYEAAPAPEVAHVSADDPFAVISTAAVDVIPRGAALTHANVIAANLTLMACLGVSAADRYLLALPLFHVTALGNALAQMHAGGASVLVSRFDADEAVRLIDRHGITHVSDFPPVLTTLLDAAGKAGSRLPSLKHVSGLDAPQTIERLHQETGAKFWTGFGQSETSGFVTIQRVLDRPGASGKPVPIAQVTLVDDYDREVPTGTPGEIVVRGPLVFQGYFGQPDVTAYTLRNGWHHTGDVGRFDADGYLYYVKRKPEKELIKPGGENVYPAEVETVIMQMEGVSGVCVYGIPDVKWGEAIKAVVEVKAAGRYSPQHVSDFVGQQDRPVQAAAHRRVHRRAAAHGRRRGRPRRREGEMGPGWSIKAHLRRWRPRPPCHTAREVNGPTNFRLRGPDMAPHSPDETAPRVRPSGAASHLDLSRPPGQRALPGGAIYLGLYRPPGIGHNPGPWGSAAFSPTMTRLRRRCWPSPSR